MEKETICFIVYSADTMPYEECLLYLSELNPAEGIEANCLVVQGVKSKAEGFNQAMEASKAKYKVYMEANTYIINKNFLNDVKALFEKEQGFDAVGVVGRKLGEEKAYGKMICDKVSRLGLKEFQEVKEPVEEVDVLENILCITVKDREWNEQTLVAGAQDYRVGVIRQETPWCLKDEAEIVTRVNEGYKI